MSLILFDYYLSINLIVFTLFAFISFVATNLDTKCIIGRLGDCGVGQVCLQYNVSDSFGRCVCRNGSDCGNDSLIITTIKPLPIYSIDDKSDNSSVIISSILGTVASITIILLAYYFGIRKGLFRDIWRRTFTQRTIEHQLLDRSPQCDDDTEAIA